jgi:hypothetical protein
MVIFKLLTESVAKGEHHSPGIELLGGDEQESHT